MKPIFLCGFMGCGKSTVGRRLAALTGRTFVDMDSYIEEQAGCTISEIFASDGEAAFRAMEHDACVTLGGKSDMVIATGGGAVLRDDNVKALSQNGTIVFLDVSEACVLERLKGDTTRPLLMRDDKEAAVHVLMSERAPRYARAASVTVSADGSAQAVADAVEAALA